MPTPAKPLVVTLVAAVTFALGAAPAYAAAETDSTAAAATAPAIQVSQQSLSTEASTATLAPINSVLELSENTSAGHNFDVQATIAAATAEIGTSRATGWGQAGECIVSAQRWVRAGGGAWTGGGDPVSNYNGAIRLGIADAAAGDIVQYENIAYPTSWVTGVHTVLITGKNDDGTFKIIESNNPTGSGLVQADNHWLPKPPSGFQAVVWRF